MRVGLMMAGMLAGCGGSALPADHSCHVVMSAPVGDVEWDAQCAIERLGFPSELTLTLPDNTWATVAYAPSAHEPFVSFTGGWGRGAWRCPGLREPESWVSEVEGTATTIFTIAFFCTDNNPEHYLVLAVEYPR